MFKNRPQFTFDLTKKIFEMILSKYKNTVNTYHANIIYMCEEGYIEINHKLVNKKKLMFEAILFIEVPHTKTTFELDTKVKSDTIEGLIQAMVDKSIIVDRSNE